MGFQHRQSRLLLGAIILAVLLLAGCDSTSASNGNNASTSASSVATITPQIVTPKSTSGSAGQGPVIATAVPTSGDPAGSQKVTLHDRTLIIYSATKEKSESTTSVYINLDVAVRNTSAKTIKNQPAFFQLTGADGDIFAYQYNSSDNFYGSIAPRTTHTGHIVFQLPAAAVSKLSLLYRPEIATETTIIQLKLS